MLVTNTAAIVCISARVCFFSHGEDKSIFLAWYLIFRVLELMYRSYWLLLPVNEPAEGLWCLLLCGGWLLHNIILKFN